MKFAHPVNVLLAGVAVSAFTVVSANAAVELNGGFAVDMAGGPAVYTDTSFQLGSVNVFTDASGDFASLLSTGDLGVFGNTLTAYNSMITGIGTSSTAMSISDFFDFAGGGYFDTTGTTPANRFQFNLSSLQSLGTGVGVGAFSGAGTIIDTDGVYSDTPATFTLSFTSGGGSTNYGFSFDTVSSSVPEASTNGVFAGALALLPLGAAGMMRFMRRRQVAS